MPPAMIHGGHQCYRMTRSSDLYGYYSLKLKFYILESHYEQEKLKAILGEKLQKSSL